MMLCVIPIVVDNSRFSNIRKNRMDQEIDPGIKDMASMKARKAKFVLSLICEGEKGQELKCP